MNTSIDVLHLGTPRVICCHRAGDVIVDPGPESSHAALVDALDGHTPRAILLTHIHFDHAGATGALVERWPDVEVWVHERGAPHLVDPARLVASARRLYGEDFDRLWGRVVPVPQENLRVLAGGERIGTWRVEYTPGHASHHVAYLDEASGTAYCGDVAGVRIGEGPLIAPTPPPDIDLEAWDASLDVLAGWEPERLALTHFGTFPDVGDHIARLREELRAAGELARNSDAEAYAAAVARRLDGLPERPAYLQASPPETLHPGLARYWAKRSDTLGARP